MEHKILSIDYKLQDGYAARIECACGWWRIATNDPRYDSIEDGRYHVAAANRDDLVLLLAEAQALPGGQLRDDAVGRYRHDLEVSEYMIERGYLESKDATLWRQSTG